MGDSVVHNEHVSISILVFIIVFITDESYRRNEYDI